MRGHRDRIRAHPQAGFAYRVLVALVGAGVVCAGLVMIPLPGPGWLVVFLGLGVLASEFAWAGRLLAYAREHVGRWTAWAGRQPLRVRLAVGLTSLLLAGATLWAILRWRGVPEWVPGIG